MKLVCNLFLYEKTWVREASIATIKFIKPSVEIKLGKVAMPNYGRQKLALIYHI